MTILIKRGEHETKLESKMRGLLWVLCMTFAFFFTSCSSDNDIEPETQTDTYINLLVSTPTTKATSNTQLEDDQVAANPTEEEKIYSIRVWAYPTNSSDDSAPIGYTEKTSLDATGSTNVSMKILRKYAQSNQNLDLYILINAESIGKGTVVAGKNNNVVTRSELANLKLDDNTEFGITESGTAKTTSVPSTGLPINRVVTNIATSSYVKESEAEASANPIKINLARAVSKLHFYFSRKQNAGTDLVKITRIELDANFLPTESPLFPEAATYSVNEKSNVDIHGTYASNISYVNKKVTLGGVENKDIKELANPSEYIKSSRETAQVYVNRLANAGIAEHNRCYFRESNKPVSGTIYYTLADGLTEHSVKFTIPGANTPAYRNHDLLVYGHFEEGDNQELQLSYYVASWKEKKATTITFN